MTTVTVLPKLADNPTVIKPYLWLAGLQVLDVLTTWVVLNFWSQHAEGNPVAAMVLNSFGLTVGLLIMLVFKLSVVWLFWRCQTGVKLASGIYSLVVANNLLFLGVGLWMIL